jgi:hypothetical protein
MASQSFRPVASDAGHDLPRPPGPSAPQNFQDVPSLGRPQGLGYRGEDRPDGDPIQPRPSPQADPLRIGPQNLLFLCFRVPHLGLQDPIGPTGLAGVLRVPVSIPSVLDDVPTPASTAPVSPGLRNPGTPPREDSLCDISLTKRSLPSRTRAKHGSGRPASNLSRTGMKGVSESCNVLCPEDSGAGRATNDRRMATSLKTYTIIFYSLLFCFSFSFWCCLVILIK